MGRGRRNEDVMAHRSRTLLVALLPLLLAANMPSCLQLPQWGVWQDYYDDAGILRSYLTPRPVAMRFAASSQVSVTPGCVGPSDIDMGALASGVVWHPIVGLDEYATRDSTGTLIGDVHGHIEAMAWLRGTGDPRSAVYPYLRTDPQGHEWWYFRWVTTWYGNPVQVSINGVSHPFIWLWIS